MNTSGSFLDQYTSSSTHTRSIPKTYYGLLWATMGLCDIHERQLNHSQGYNLLRLMPLNATLFGLHFSPVYCRYVPLTIRRKVSQLLGLYRYEVTRTEQAWCMHLVSAPVSPSYFPLKIWSLAALAQLVIGRVFFRCMFLPMVKVYFSYTKLALCSLL